MAHVNIEIKARCNNPEHIRQLLEDSSAEFKGTDHQIDTYFCAPNGRFKLRQGNIENALIFYHRPNTTGPKRADVSLYHTDTPGGAQLHEVLTNALDIRIVVDKQREIYFIDNVKFHIDTVEELGNFVEIEAIDENDTLGPEKLRAQCDYYIKLFAITDADLVNVSYSDLLLKRNKP